MIFRIGYEIEFVSFLNPEHVRQKLLRAGFMIPELGSGRAQYLNWYLTTDRSIKDTSGRAYQGLEIISPIMGVTQGLRALRKLFKFLDENGFETNETTGFHVGVSYALKEHTLGVNYGKLIAGLDEKRLLTMWNRHGNTYCKSQYDFILESLVKNYGHRLGQDRQWAAHVSQMVNVNDKYYTVNFTKLSKKNPYYEFRLMGGPNYHKRYRDILKTVKIFLKAMKRGITPSNEYLTAKEIAQIAADYDTVRLKMEKNSEELKAQLRRSLGHRPQRELDEYVSSNIPQYVADHEVENYR